MANSRPKKLPLTVEHLDELRLLYCRQELPFSAPWKDLSKRYVSAKSRRGKFANLFVKFENQPECSDLTICCKERKFFVHRIIVCAHSQFFEIACKAYSQEDTNQRIHLDDEDPVYIERLVSYFYRLDYDDIYDEVIGRFRLSVHATIYTLGSKYKVPALQALAIEKTNFEYCILKEFSEAAKIVWTSTPASDKTLRDLYLKEFCQVYADAKPGIRSYLEEELDEQVVEDLKSAGNFLIDVVNADTKTLVSAEKEKTELGSAKRKRVLYGSLCEL